VYILARSQPMVARVPSRESGIPFAPDIHEGIIVMSVRVWFTDAQQGMRDCRSILGDYFATVYHMEVCILGKGTCLGSRHEY